MHPISAAAALASAAPLPRQLAEITDKRVSLGERGKIVAEIYIIELKVPGAILNFGASRLRTRREHFSHADLHIFWDAFRTSAGLF